MTRYWKIIGDRKAIGAAVLATVLLAGSVARAQTDEQQANCKAGQPLRSWYAPAPNLIDDTGNGAQLRNQEEMACARKFQQGNQDGPQTDPPELHNATQH